MTGRLVGLDLLRGLAIALVMLRHAFPTAFPGAGVVGVVMFFALSGHLITGLLLADHSEAGRIRLRRFYARRLWRLVPALVAVLAAIVAVTLIADPLDDRGELPRTILVALTWTANLPFDQGSDGTFHLWTLATEEQFYLLWPALLGWALARRRTGPVVIGLALGSLIACVATLFWLSEDPDLAYALPTSWAICFVIGAASRTHPHWLVLAPRLVPLALLTLLVLSVIPLRGHALTYLLGGPVIATSTVVLIAAWRARPPQIGVALQPLMWLGTVSYGAYLWNYPLSLWLREWYGDSAAVGLFGLGLTVALAALTWRWVEEPLLRRRDRLPVPAS